MDWDAVAIVPWWRDERKGHLCRMVRKESSRTCWWLHEDEGEDIG